MLNLLLIAVPFVIIALLMATARAARVRRHAGSTTTALVVKDGRITRTMNDGREESVTVAALTWIEVVCTRVPTADAARGFALLGESDERGCLIPLGVGWESEVLIELGRLRGFDLRTFDAAVGETPPCRTVVWGTKPSDPG